MSKLLRLSSITLATIAFLAWAPGIIATPVQWSGNGHYYDIVQGTNLLHWDEASSAAQVSSFNGLQGHLVTINSAPENAFVFGQFNAAVSDPLAWIGGLATFRGAGDWHWITNEPMSYTNWAPGEPTAGPYATMVLNRPGQQGLWVGEDYPRTWGGSYIVEYEPHCSTIIPGTTPVQPGNGVLPPGTLQGNLKQWSGSSWIPVTTFSTATFNSAKKSVVIIHGWDDSYKSQWVEDMARELVNQAGGDPSAANILTWDWEKGANTSFLNQLAADLFFNGLDNAAKSASNGNVEGMFLANDLNALGIPGQNVQLIGHSNGAAVAGGAAARLKVLGQTVEQITTLDAPNIWLAQIPAADVAAVLLGDVQALLSKANALQYIKPASAKHIEVYYSDNRWNLGFGTALVNKDGTVAPNVFNGKLVSPVGGSTIDDHQNTPDWYTVTGVLGESDQFLAGMNWALTSSHREPFGVFPAGNFEEDPSIPRRTGYFPGTITVGASDLILAKVSGGDDFASGTMWYGTNSTIVPTATGFAAHMVKGSDAYLYRTLSIDPDAIFLTFDYDIETAGPGDYLTLSFGDQNLYVLYMDVTTAGMVTSDQIYVGDLAGQTDTLLLYLHNMDPANQTSVLVTNLSFTGVPEPASLALLAVGGLVLMRRRRPEA